MAWTSYKDLTVWQKAMEATVEIYRLVKKLPHEEKFALSDQMRRAAVSVPSNIAEGHARLSDKEFAHFLSIAQGSKAELETQLCVCTRVGYLTEADAGPVMALLDETGRMLSAMSRKPRGSLPKT